MSTLAEIEAAIDQLPSAEQERLFARLAERLPSRLVPEHDPVLLLVDQLTHEHSAEEPTNIAANYKEYLYGHGSAE